MWWKLDVVRNASCKKGHRKPRVSTTHEQDEYIELRSTCQKFEICVLIWFESGTLVCFLRMAASRVWEVRILGINRIRLPIVLKLWSAELNDTLGKAIFPFYTRAPELRNCGFRELLVLGCPVSCRASLTKG